MDLIKSFYDKAKNINFNVTGLLLENNDVLSLGSDSKLIGRIFELVSFGVLSSICKENGWTLQETESQTVYPDFTIIMEDNKKIAIDIKTTYRRYNAKGQICKFGFTLGAFASFLRNNTKNIAYPYDQYIKHYVIGFIYNRVSGSKAGQVLHIGDTIQPPYNVEILKILEVYYQVILTTLYREMGCLQNLAMMYLKITGADILDIEQLKKFILLYSNILT